MKLLLIFNPNAASGRAAGLMPRVCDFLEGFAELEVLPTAYPGHATDLVANADVSGFDGVIAAGGDGTLFEVLNGLYRHPASERVPLGLIPVGTGNAFARDLGLMPGDWKKGARIIAGGVRRALDVGYVQTRDSSFHFLNIIGMGFPVAALTTAKKLKGAGSSAYTLAVFREILRLKSYPLTIEIDGNIFEQDNIFVEISNTRYTGTSFLMAPSARLDDGLLDITLLRNLPRLRLLRLFPTIYSGRHVEFDEVSTYRGRKITITAPEGLQLVPDGELHGETPVTISCLEKDLEIFSPSSFLD